jgi:hypothetical protein
VSVEFQSYRRDLLRITRQECDFGRWEMASRGPHSQLRDYVIGYVGLRSTMRLTRERHLPSGEAALVVNLGTPHDVIGSGAQSGTLKFRSVAAMGVHDQPFVTRSAGAKHLLLVRLTPPGARLLFDVAIDQLFNRWVDLDEIDGVLARRIEGRVHEPRGWNDLFDLMDSVLAERLAAVRISAPGVLWAWWELRRSGGLASIDSLADHLDWSHKWIGATSGSSPDSESTLVYYPKRRLRLFVSIESCDCRVLTIESTGRVSRRTAGTTTRRT